MFQIIHGSNSLKQGAFLQKTKRNESLAQTLCQNDEAVFYVLILCILIIQSVHAIIIDFSVLEYVKEAVMNTS